MVQLKDFSTLPWYESKAHSVETVLTILNFDFFPWAHAIWYVLCGWAAAVTTTPALQVSPRSAAHTPVSPVPALSGIGFWACVRQARLSYGVWQGRCSKCICDLQYVHLPVGLLGPDPSQIEDIGVHIPLNDEDHVTGSGMNFNCKRLGTVLSLRRGLTKS